MGQRRPRFPSTKELEVQKMTSRMETFAAVLIVAGVSFVLTALFGKLLIPMLRRLKAGQSIK